MGLGCNGSRELSGSRYIGDADPLTNVARGSICTRVDRRCLLLRNGFHVLVVSLRGVMSQRDSPRRNRLPP
jgi:hypothetical protein